MKDYRDYLIELVDSGMLDARDAVIMLMKYMSNDDVKDCLDWNEIVCNDQFSDKFEEEV